MNDYDRGRLDMAREVFALAEDTQERYQVLAETMWDSAEGAFYRGRISEAKSIAKTISKITPLA
jgi:hypothetical protein